MQRVNVVLAGVTGTGKSTTGNVLAGRACFQSSSAAASETQRCQHTSCQVPGPSGAMVDLRIIDSPGFSDTGKPPQQVLDDVLQFKDVAVEGVHAFIFTVQKGRFTKEHDSALQAFASALGQEALPRTILTFTHFDSSDSLENFMRPNKPNQMLQRWSQQVGCCIAVENLHDGSNARAKMLEAIFKIKTQNKPYSNAHLDEAKQWRHNFLLRVQQSLREPHSRHQAQQAIEAVAEGRQTRKQAEETLASLASEEKRVQDLQRQSAEHKHRAETERREKVQVEERAAQAQRQHAQQMQSMGNQLQAEKAARLRQAEKHARKMQHAEAQSALLSQQLQQHRNTVADLERQLAERPSETVVYIDRAAPVQTPDHVTRGAGFGAAQGALLGGASLGPPGAVAGLVIGSLFGAGLGAGRQNEAEARQRGDQ